MILYMFPCAVDVFGCFIDLWFFSLIFADPERSGGREEGWYDKEDGCSSIILYMFLCAVEMIGWPVDI